MDIGSVVNTSTFRVPKLICMYILSLTRYSIFGVAFSAMLYKLLRNNIDGISGWLWVWWHTYCTCSLLHMLILIFVFSLFMYVRTFMGKTQKNMEISLPVLHLLDIYHKNEGFFTVRITYQLRMGCWQIHCWRGERGQYERPTSSTSEKVEYYTCCWSSSDEIRNSVG